MGQPAIPTNLTQEELKQLTIEQKPKSGEIEADAVLLLDGKPIPTAEDAP